MVSPAHVAGHMATIEHPLHHSAVQSDMIFTLSPPLRVDQRGFGVVRSDLELSQVMCELFEQEEAPARSRRTHALIPAMVLGRPEERLAFHSTNGLIQDPMAVYRASKVTNVWTDEEKTIFREKYVHTCTTLNFNFTPVFFTNFTAFHNFCFVVFFRYALYPKNFEAISSFLPGKTTADCVRYYYLSKKNEKFKQVVRKVTFKRRKFIKPGVRLHSSTSHSYSFSSTYPLKNLVPSFCLVFSSFLSSKRELFSLHVICIS